MIWMNQKKKYRHLILHLLLFKDIYFINVFCFRSPALNFHFSMMQWDLENDKLMGKSMFEWSFSGACLSLSSLVSKADCYVELKLPTASPRVSQTQVVDNSENPEWNETFQYRIHSAVKVRALYGAGWTTCIFVLASFWYFIQNQGFFITLKTSVACKVSVVFSGTKSCTVPVQWYKLLWLTALSCKLQLEFSINVLVMQLWKGKLWHYLVEFKEILWLSKFLFDVCCSFHRS